MNWDSIVYFNPNRDTKLRCSCGCGKELMVQSFMEKVDDLRAHLGIPLRVTSGYRCPEYNNRVSSTGFDGPHTTGHALDIAVHGKYAWALLNGLEKVFTGVGVDQKGDHSTRFIHIDDLPEAPGRPRPWVWSY